MKLTREQWAKLNDMTLKERVERLEELVDEIESEQSRIRMKEFEKEMDAINDEADTKCLWALVVSMILVWATLWVLACKLFA